MGEIPGPEHNDVHEPELAETFAAEFRSAKWQEIQSAMRQIGEFSFRTSQVSEDGSTVSYIGERGDGTTIEITVHAGDEYKAPAERAMEFDLAPDTGE